MSLMMRQQRFRAASRMVSRELALLGVRARVEQQAGHADHAVHRRADLVAHVGQELRLGARARPPRPPSRAASPPRTLPRGDVAPHGEHHLPSRNRDVREGDLDRKLLTVEAAVHPLESLVSALAGLVHPRESQVPGRHASRLVLGREIQRCAPQDGALVGRPEHVDRGAVAVEEAGLRLEEKVGLGRLLEQDAESLLRIGPVGQIVQEPDLAGVVLIALISTVRLAPSFRRSDTMRALANLPSRSRW